MLHVDGVAPGLYDCVHAVQVTDASLRLLGRHGGLADLRLEECPALTDAGLVHLSGQPMWYCDNAAMM